jgi:peptide/histidine transporter 3/4
MSVISTITVLMFLPFYDRVLIPILRKWTGYETGITFLQKIGVGKCFFILSDVAKTLVEHKRRNVAVSHHLTLPRDQLPMSAWWLTPQYVLSGLSESFTMVGHMEFFYYMLPEHMTSTGSACLMVAMAAATSLSTVVLNLVKKLTEHHGDGGWLVENINLAHLDYFYALMTGLIILDLLFFLFVARWYRRQRHVKQMMLQFS